MSQCTFVKSVHLCSSVRKEYKSFVGNYISHRFSQMNRGLSAHRGNPQTSASRRQISQTLLLCITERYTYHELKRSVLSVDLMSLWFFVCSVHLCSSVRERTPSVTFLRSSVTLSQPPPTMSHPSVTHQTCSSVTLSPISSNLFTCLLVHLSTCLVTLSPSYPVSPYPVPCPLHISYYPLTIILLPYPLVSLEASCPPQIEMLKPQYSNL